MTRVVGASDGHPGGGHAGPGLRPGRDGPPGQPAPRAGGHGHGGRGRADWPTISGSSWALGTGWPSSPPGRRCPSNGSAPRCTPWAGGSGSCGSWSAPGGPGSRPGARRGDAGRGGATGTATGSARGDGGGDRAPDIVVAPVKAVLQRLGPWRHAGRPVTVRPGRPRRPRRLVARLVGMGYRRESLVEHRGELAVRGGIVDVFPSTGDEPVRIDLWGDEVERLTRFDVADQRSVVELGRVELFGCRELVPDEAMRERAAGPGGHGPVGPPPVGPAGRRPGVRRHGVVAALAVGRRGAALRPAAGGRPGGGGGAPAGAGPGRPICSTRRPPWPGPWPRPGAWTTGPTPPGCTCPSSGCSRHRGRRRLAGAHG